MKKYFSYIYFGLMIFFITNPVFADCVKCGEDTMAVPSAIPKFTSSLVTLAQLIVPIVLIVTGMVRYIKVVVSGEDKTAKEVNQSFIKSIIAAVLVFISIAIVKFAFSLVSKSDSELGDITACVSCFIDDNDNCSATACPERETGLCSMIKNKSECDRLEGVCKWSGNSCILVQNGQAHIKSCYKKTCGTNVSYEYTDNLTRQDGCNYTLLYDVHDVDNCSNNYETENWSCYLVEEKDSGQTITYYSYIADSSAKNGYDGSTLFNYTLTDKSPEECRNSNNEIEACYLVRTVRGGNQQSLTYSWIKKSLAVDVVHGDVSTNYELVRSASTASACDALKNGNTTNNSNNNNNSNSNNNNSNINNNGSGSSNTCWEGTIYTPSGDILARTYVYSSIKPNDSSGIKYEKSNYNVSSQDDCKKHTAYCVKYNEYTITGGITGDKYGFFTVSAKDLDTRYFVNAENRIEKVCLDKGLTLP